MLVFMQNQQNHQGSKTIFYDKDNWPTAIETEDTQLSPAQPHDRQQVDYFCGSSAQSFFSPLVTWAKPSGKIMPFYSIEYISIARSKMGYQWPLH